MHLFLSASPSYLLEKQVGTAHFSLLFYYPISLALKKWSNQFCLVPHFLKPSAEHIDQAPAKSFVETLIHCDANWESGSIGIGSVCFSPMHLALCEVLIRALVVNLCLEVEGKKL